MKVDGTAIPKKVIVAEHARIVKRMMDVSIYGYRRTTDYSE